MLTGRLTSLRTLAENTDGLAIVDSNDLAKGLRRVVDDLSSYYLLGYYSNGPLDGKFHSINVRVKRTGVQVRARRGYLAATAGGSGTHRARRESRPCADTRRSRGARDGIGVAAALSVLARNVAALARYLPPGRPMTNCSSGWSANLVPPTPGRRALRPTSA
jgi:hypothetical protein